MKRFLLFSLALILMGSLVFAGGGGQQSSSSSSTSSALTRPGDWTTRYSEPVTVSIGRSGRAVTDFGPGEDIENNAYNRWIREKYNIIVKSAFYLPEADYIRRVTLAIASSDIPDILQLNNALQLNELMESGMVEDLTGLFDKWGSPLYKAAVDTFGGLREAMYSCYMNGRQYAMSTIAPPGQDNLIWIREDWRVRLNLPEPKTTDDFIRLAEAFVQNDMAGNRTTTGIELQPPIVGRWGGLMTADPWFNAMGAYPGLWIDDGRGRITYGSILPEVKEGLRLMRDLYARGIIPRDFVTRDHFAVTAAGQSGVISSAWWGSGTLFNLTRNNNPNADWRPYNWQSPTTGKRHTYSQNVNYGWGVVRKGYSNPEVLIRFLNLQAEVRAYYDGVQLSAEEEARWQPVIPMEVKEAYYGNQTIDWVQWPVALMTNFADFIPRLARYEMLNVERFKAGDTAGMSRATLINIENIVNWERGDRTNYGPWMSYMRYRAKCFVHDDFNSGSLDIKKAYYPYSTETMQARWANLTDLQNLAFSNIIMGTVPLDHFDTFVRDWLAQGGSRIIDEVSKQFGK